MRKVTYILPLTTLVFNRKSKVEDTVKESLGEFPSSNLKRRVDDMLR